ncbi:F0F1 ATP synthase subunit alpha [Candidatus Uhrbacteria bacterium CG_4_10_14_0_8_um_filter_58_22]|uniref:ATP synthase subunit alpha n=1 Tax=Candidatus Uhrbacteria bacterium CG_4_10_14_0_8_um_filter_58_22 TaxID=1975029 RepID=A0A2M7Q9T3_9BACT|nr:MAG: F0F1 ATP synthase subunit alpha [Parcubacteria group bacterium CG1_02_58_44]PIY62597.1 MAG: F0F1 ATP synthase subunit alpha [Candidatus Uhrbacteria bacterium CG_4_10_14_0_8_um_filter_58_22]
MASKDFIIESLKKEIGQLDIEAKVRKVGTVVEVADGIARMTGLSECLSMEMLEFSDGTFGVALNLEKETVGAMILGDCTHIKEGDEVRTTGRVLSIPVSEGIVGRVIDPLGRPLDGRGPIAEGRQMPIEKIAPGVITRKSVSVPLQTGLKAIDAMIPIGRGQRELIIGDRQTGKTAVAIDAIINQKDTGVVCIYVAIGQKESKVAKMVAKLEEAGAMANTIVVVAGASDPASLSFLAPYAGTAIGEYFMDQGKDALVVHDDLSKHAWAYREVSLLLRRPPGREAYPGDVFYLHSRLLERSARLNEDNGGGSLTALPIIETQAGDVSAYIPTNVISITDGQIYLEPDLFYRGIRPALNIGISVSRVGSAAQVKAMKKVAGRLRLDMAQFRELEAFAQFASDLDESTRKQISRGKRAVEVLKQDQYETMTVAQQVAILFAVTRGHLDDVKTDRVREWESGFHRYLEGSRRDVLTAIEETGDLSEDIEAKLVEAIAEFKKTVTVEA